jgi:hypothetical protein
MIGNNDFIFNEATMCQAMQLYLNVCMHGMQVPAVTSIKEHTEHGCRTFIIATSADAEKPPTPKVFTP